MNAKTLDWIPLSPPDMVNHVFCAGSKMICSNCWKEKKNIEMVITHWKAKYDPFWDYMDLEMKYLCPKCGQKSFLESHQRFNPSFRLHSSPFNRPENDPL